jgi:hypothetical protein
MPAAAAHALGQIALGHQFELDLAAAVQLVEDPAVHLAREAADDLAHLAGLEQGGQAGVAIAGVVVDHGELACTLGDQAVDQLAGDARGAEAADEHGGAVLNAGQGLSDRVGDLVDHGCLQFSTRLRHWR